MRGTRRAIFGELAWQAIERAVLNGLLLSPEAVPTVDIAEHCHVANLCTEEQLRDTLQRLADRGQIRRTTIEVRDAEQPLLGAAIFEAWEAVRVGGRCGHGSR